MATPAGTADQGLRIKTEVRAPEGSAGTGRTAIELKTVNLSYGDNHVLHDISMDIGEKMVTAFIGPSGCGKSTLLRCLNRMNDLIDNTRITGTIKVEGADIYAPKTDVIDVRRRIGMVFQKSNPFPKSIYENVVYGLRIAGIRDKATLDEAAERSLRGAALWDEVKDRLGESGLSPLRRAAAAALHRPRHRGGAGDRPHGRALLGPGSHRHGQDRGADVRPQGALHDRHRHPQPAAGGARVRQDGLLLAGAPGRVRRDLRRCSRTPARS